MKHLRLKCLSTKEHSLQTEPATYLWLPETFKLKLAYIHKILACASESICSNILARLYGPIYKYDAMFEMIFFAVLASVPARGLKWADKEWEMALIWLLLSFLGFWCTKESRSRRLASSWYPSALHYSSFSNDRLFSTLNLNPSWIYRGWFSRTSEPLLNIQAG